MPFLGSTPADKYQSLAKQTITGDGSTAYTLNRSVTNAYDMEVFINNVRQEPDTSYTASGNTITFTAAVTASDSCYLIYQGQSVGSINPPANSVGSSQVANNTITTAHLHTGLSVPDSNIAAVATSKLTGDIPYANMPAGSVVQVKNNIYSTWTTANSTSFAGVNTGFAQSITPTSTSNEILISITAAGLYMANSGNTIIFALYRDGSLVSILDAACRHVTAGNGGNGAWTFKETAPSTSAVNYQVYWKAGTAQTIGVNNYTGSNINGSTKSSITVMEIAQ